MQVADVTDADGQKDDVDEETKQTDKQPEDCAAATNGTTDATSGTAGADNEPAHEPAHADAATPAELRAILGNDDDEEKRKDYDIRGLQRIEKNRQKKLQG